MDNPRDSLVQTIFPNLSPGGFNLMIITEHIVIVGVVGCRLYSTVRIM